MADGLSIPALEAALTRVKQRLKRKKAQRARLVRKIAKLDKETQALEGARIGAPKKGRKRKRGRRAARGGNLGELIPRVLARASRPLGMKEIADGVVALGYKSSSKKFVNVVAQYVYNSADIRRVSRGRYALKKTAGKKAAGALAKPKKSPARRATKRKVVKKKASRKKSARGGKKK